MKIIPFVLTDLRAAKRIIWLFEMIFWPLISLVSFGIFSTFVNATLPVKILLFTGIIGWSTINLAQTSISKGFMHEMWDKCVRQTFAAPINFTEFVIGHWVYGIIEIIVAFTLMSLAALYFFGFNIFSIGIYLPLSLGLIAISGLVIGVIATSLILLFGLKVDFIVWSIVDMIVFISGIYYSISVFPPIVQIISHFFPVAYVFEGMRAVLAGNPAQTIFLRGYFISLVWVTIVLFLNRKIESYARKTGFYQKYG